jgi:hypothetical protein
MNDGRPVRRLVIVRHFKKAKRQAKKPLLPEKTVCLLPYQTPKSQTHNDAGSLSICRNRDREKLYDLKHSSNSDDDDALKSFKTAAELQSLLDWLQPRPRYACIFLPTGLHRSENARDLLWGTSRKW